MVSGALCKPEYPHRKSLLVYDPSIPEDILGLERKEEMADFIRAIYPLFMPVEMK